MSYGIVNSSIKKERIFDLHRFCLIINLMDISYRVPVIDVWKKRDNGQPDSQRDDCLRKSVTNCMEQSPWEPNDSSASWGIPHILWYPKLQCCNHGPITCFLSWSRWFSPYSSISCLSKINFNVCIGLPSGHFSQQNPVCVSVHPGKCPCPVQPFLLNLIMWIIFGVEYKLWSPLLYSFWEQGSVCEFSQERPFYLTHAGMLKYAAFNITKERGMLWELLLSVGKETVTFRYVG